MQRHSFLKTTLIVFLLITFLSDCKKESTPAKDYSTSVKDKTWWGEFTYAGKTKEYYSLYFKADGTFTWSQLLGDYAGTWKLVGNKLTASFTDSKLDMTATITDDNTFTSITYPANVATISSGYLVANPGIALENTVWNGSLYNGVATGLLGIQLKFLPAIKVEVITTNTNGDTFLNYNSFYSRPINGGWVRFKVDNNSSYFGIITSAIEIKGSRSFSDYPFQVTKQ
jgi:hypothetical protein